MIDNIIINKMRENSRFSLAKLSRKLKLPATTMYYKLDCIFNKYIKKHVSLIDFEMLYFKRIFFFVDTNSSELIAELSDDCINNIYRHYGGLIIEGIFLKNKDVDSFRKKLVDLKIDFYESPIKKVLKQETFKVNSDLLLKK
ncbi:hypothetical protein K9L67_04940 [Candidatus Woesearchaeota archaeon]|nr:hypothetical protein [Candidatus Woesearchaeota archaeon]MCF7901544.1 hypothetical protein [Candidatus Woesearchaeota archaeon]MCF8013960.1 hypothetical protein [Candidatus Woesearchaeota archaeon]